MIAVGKFKDEAILSRFTTFISGFIKCTKQRKPFVT